MPGIDTYQTNERLDANAARVSFIKYKNLDPISGSPKSDELLVSTTSDTRQESTDHPEVRYTNGFVAWLKSDSLENQSSFDIQSLYEIYINSICFYELPSDPDIPIEDVVFRF